MSSEIVYTPKSRIRSPIRLFQSMWFDLLASRELAWRLMVRDISAQYRQSFLGIAWAFIPPVVTAIGVILANDSGLVNSGDTTIPRAAYVVFSMALWQTFVESFMGPVQAVTLAKPMLARINFPREAVILAKLGEVFFNFAIKLILITGVFIWFKVSVSWTVFLAPVALIHIVLFGTLVGVFLAPLAVLYKDVGKSLNLLAGFWLFITPVFYAAPEKGAFSVLVRLNPVTPLLQTTRELSTTGIVSNPLGFWIVSAITIAGLLLVWVAFRLAMPYVIERVSS